MSQPPVVLFDGHCHLCNGVVDFLLRVDRDRRLRYAPLQGRLGTALREGHQKPLPDSVLFWDGGEILSEMDAILAIARVLGPPWPVAGLLGLFPRSLGNRLYRLVARQRARWFGREELCRVPAPEERDLFLD